MENKNSRKKEILIMIFFIALILIGGSYAWYSYRSNKTAMVLTVGDINRVQVTLSPYQINAALSPTLTYEDNEYTQVTAVNNKESSTLVSLYYQINSIDTTLVDSNFKYMILKSTDGSSYSEYLEGDFSFAVTGEDLTILEETVSSNTTYYYQVYLWIDGSSSNQSDMQSGAFDGELRASIEAVELYTDSVLNGADPVVPEGLIPVTIANDGTVTTVSRYEEWYNYTDKEWANAVLVSSSGTQTRDYYESNSEVEVASSDILAYYVWVPRYKYEIWTLEESSSGSEQTINIIFESKDDEASTGTAVGEYRTHPAFTFGDDELSGIWAGKFETTGSKTTPTILPNVSSLINQNVSTQFQTALKFAGGTLSSGTVTFTGNDTYGLTNEVDSHMMKNSEWGAVAYLSHSIYGINGEIRENNYYSSGFKTGCGATTLDEEYNFNQSNKCEITFGGADEYPQSTTGNITGIFDMSGGASDNVMGVYANSSGSLWSGKSTTENSGFTGLVSSDDISYSGIKFPGSKYYDKYKQTSTIASTFYKTACDGKICYGHALTEVNEWYSDYIYFVTPTFPWFARGFDSYYGNNSGAFSYGAGSGAASSYDGFRSVLVA